MKKYMSLLLVLAMLAVPVLALGEETVIQYDSDVSELVSDLAERMDDPDYRAYFSAVMVVDSGFSLKDHGVALDTKELSYAACQDGQQTVCFMDPKNAGVYYLLEHHIEENTATCTILKDYSQEKMEALLEEMYRNNWRTNEPGAVAKCILLAMRDVGKVRK